MTELGKTSFIGFLNQEYLSPILNRGDVFDKELVCETSKLQKVLDVFIADEKNSGKKIIDDVLIKSWQSASQAKKEKMLNSFLKKQKFKKSDLDEMLLLLNKNSKEFKRKTSIIVNDWRSVLVTVCFLAFVLSTLIVRLFPATADDMLAFASNVYKIGSNNFLFTDVAKNKHDFAEKVSKDDLGLFIRENSEHIIRPQNKNPYSINVSLDEIKGRVAGVSEENIIPSINVKPPNIKELRAVKKSENSKIQKFVNKQVEFSEIINRKLKNIFR